MALSPEDRQKVQQVGIIGALVAGALIALPGPDYNIPIGIYKLYERIGTLEKQVEAQQDKYDKEKLRIERIPAMQRELEERGPEIRRYEARLPKSTKTPELFRDIDRFKFQAGLDITVQTKIDPVDKGDYVELPIRIEARGTYDSIATFINQLERNQRFSQIKELRLTEKPGETTGQEEQNYSEHDVSMRISTFMFKDQVVEEESKAVAAGAAAKEEAAPRKP
ncbi:MAG: type 4a pilus biogenesis protein PilO [Candidatus Omnitrophica bacterium]|nr:hypothetical protein [bacterium]NUN94691.1 type 4a pilus biogenesis protein PilO [Candidatus Omnitrophota bacterium]